MEPYQYFLAPIMDQQAQVTISAWNNNSYAVTQLIGVIGVDSRYGTVV